MLSEVQWAPADNAQDLAFAKALARRAMMPYYTRHGLLWRDEDFDAGWSWRENYRLRGAGADLGFISLSHDGRALYIRELHLLESARGRGYGGQILQAVHADARRRRLPAVRLTVFKDNPAQRLYARQGFVTVGEEGCFWRMECPCPAPSQAPAAPVRE
ncbi:GNAT family N-acetyltransferase [Pseudomonas sp. NPDC007930]|uniref:GNAT family N-acetyltransferase n=1 Tax=Pseudomonas sp. NPDC007930 TaxID=3364417 RepID=UPI0036ED3B6E